MCARARARACVCVRACVRDFLWLVSLCLCAFDYFFFGRPVSVSVLLSLRPSLSVPFSLRPPSLTLSLSLFPHFLSRSLARSLHPSVICVCVYVCVCVYACVCVCVCVCVYLSCCDSLCVLFRARRTHARTHARARTHIHTHTRLFFV